MMGTGARVGVKFGEEVSSEFVGCVGSGWVRIGAAGGDCRRGCLAELVVVRGLRTRR